MTVLEAIQRSVDFLAKKGVDSPRLQSELLLAHALGVPRMRLYLDFERTLTTAEQDQLRELVRRRGLREPLQHIVGSTSFCGLDIAVNPHVLVPRPETELLAEGGWQFLNSRPASPAPSALDFGTGSGCLAIAVAVKCPAARVVAIDVSAAALAVARGNIVRHKLEGRIELKQGDGFSTLSLPNPLTPALSPNGGEGGTLGSTDRASSGLKAPLFDLIISNPPYIPTAEIATLQQEVRDHDPRAALDGGEDGLKYYRLLAREAAHVLKPGGRLMVELGDGQESAVTEIFREQKWIVEAVKADYNARPRILIAHRSVEPGARSSRQD